jgi:FMN phosphatase YigB (HAD superfamily)
MAKDKTFVFDLNDTLVWSPNLENLFVAENPELLKKYLADPKSHAEEVEEICDAYVAGNRVSFEVYPETVEVLNRLRQSGKITILSSSSANGLRMIADRTGISPLVDETLSYEDFPGRDKKDPRLYSEANEILGSRGLDMWSYVDDKSSHAGAAGRSGVVPVVYYIDRKRKATLREAKQEGFGVIKSLRGISD